jgi:hypothetical protein
MDADSKRRCERCDDEALPKERFCTRCRRRYLCEIRQSGYLAEPPYRYPSKYRFPWMRENVQETKYGIDD